MKLIINNKWLYKTLPALFCSILLQGVLHAQVEKTETKDSTNVENKAKLKPVRNTFESVWIIDNQTVMVPIKKTFEMDIMHRFGIIKNGYKDFYGLFAPSNIRIGLSYVPIKNLNVGLGLAKANMVVDGSLKYSLFTQSRKGGYPVSATVYSNIGWDTRDKSNFIYVSERFSFFNQLIIARKVTDRLSVQVAPSMSHQNSVYGYFKHPTDSTTVLAGEMKHDHFAISVAGRWKLKDGMFLLANYDQPITKHTTNNPNPNISFGIEMTTSAHAFQIFLGNYYNLSPQRNNLFNRNDFSDGQFLIGFNITRLWNY